MSEIDELEPYATEPPPIGSRRDAAGRRNMMKAMPANREKASAARTRLVFLDSSRRQIPSLPCFKCMEGDE